MRQEPFAPEEYVLKLPKLSEEKSQHRTPISSDADRQEPAKDGGMSLYEPDRELGEKTRQMEDDKHDRDIYEGMFQVAQKTFNAINDAYELQSVGHASDSEPERVLHDHRKLYLKEERRKAVHSGLQSFIDQNLHEYTEAGALFLRKKRDVDVLEAYVKGLKEKRANHIREKPLKFVHPFFKLSNTS